MPPRQNAFGCAGAAVLKPLCAPFAGAAALILGMGFVPLMPEHSVAAPLQLAQASTTVLSDAAARQATERILEAVRQKDGQLRYSQFATALQKTSSPQMVQRSLDRWPQLEGWTIESVRSGLRGNTSVEVVLQFPNGPRNATVVLNPKGKLEAQAIDFADKASVKLARGFIQAVIDGQFVTARSMLALPLQKEISPSALQQKWLELQQITGNFQKIDDVLEADHGSEGTLVLVETEFTRMTDNIFVILDKNNTITGVDFPIDAKVR